jgi:hypothetical protein
MQLKAAWPRPRLLYILLVIHVVYIYRDTGIEYPNDGSINRRLTVAACFHSYVAPLDALRGWRWWWCSILSMKPKEKG